MNGKLRLARLLCCALATSALVSTACAADSAGNAIINTASLSFDQGDTHVVTTSNTVTLKLNELIDVTIKAASPTVFDNVGGLDAIPFIVTNSGNGLQSFIVSGAANEESRVIGIAADSDGDGVYDAGRDTLLTDGEIAIGAGKSTTLFILVDDSLDAGDHNVVTATVKAKRGTGAAGTVLAGAGADGIDAVLGTTGGQATASSTLVSGTTPSLVKSQEVVWSNDGTKRPLRDSIVLYTLEARFPTATRGVEITDPLPAGTDYIPGSLTLDGAPLSDGDDADQGGFVGNIIRVALGTVPSGQTRTVQFKVKIQ